VKFVWTACLTGFREAISSAASSSSLCTCWSGSKAGFLCTACLQPVVQLVITVYCELPLNDL
jgi:hypothetical protein